MFTQIIEHTGNGTAAEYALKFDAVGVWVVPDAAAHIAFHTALMWCGRSNVFGASDSIDSGVRIIGRKLFIGASATVNNNGTRYRIVAVGADSGDVETVSWCGNGQNGRTIKLARQETPSAVMVKRDSTRPPVVKVAGVAVSAMDGATVGDSITLGAGLLTLTNSAHVNEWDSASELGEGIDALVFHPTSGVKIGSYTGTGGAQNVAIGCDAAMVIAWRPGVAETAKVFTRNDTGALCKSCDANAPAAGGRLAPGLLVLTGSVGNNTGGAYSYIAIPAREPRVARPLAPAAVIRGKRALSLPGRGSLGYVDCGTGLNIDGEITLEWLGEVPGDAQSGASFDGWLLGKAATAQGTTAGASWGMSAVSRIDGGHAWQGPHMAPVTNGRVYYSGPLATASWRTGILVPAGIHMHQVVHRGGGEWEYWLDGVLVKQRKLATDGVTSSAAHRVTMGARWTGSAYSNASRMLILGGRVYSSALTDSEIKARHARARLASGESDVTRALAAAWEGEALAIGSTAWSDPVGGNIGTITGGAVVDL